MYVDTSALVKTLVAEEGSPVAIRTWNSATARTTSLLSYPEARAALARARRAARLSDGQLQRAKRRLSERLAQMHLIDVTEDLAFAAGDLADAHGLRGYDAVHLASALLFGPDVVVVTWDADLRGAAEAFGLAVAGG